MNKNRSDLKKPYLWTRYFVSDKLRNINDYHTYKTKPLIIFLAFASQADGRVQDFK